MAKVPAETSSKLVGGVGRGGGGGGGGGQQQKLSPPTPFADSKAASSCCFSKKTTTGQQTSERLRGINSKGSEVKVSVGVGVGGDDQGCGELGGDHGRGVGGDPEEHPGRREVVLTTRYFLHIFNT